MLRRRVELGLGVLGVVLAACGFDGQDSGEGSGSDVMPPPCPFSYGDVCVDLAEAMPQSFIGDVVIDTATALECAKAPVVAADVPYCIIAGSTIDVAAGATLRGVGSRPLVLAASGAITIAGTIDVSSARAIAGPLAAPEVLGAGADIVSCAPFERIAESKPEGGGGGAGGSFDGLGGNGGNGNNDNPLYSGGGKPAVDGELEPTTALRGGCRGQDGGHNTVTMNGGRGGAGGGVVYLASQTSVAVLATGKVGANGAGGLGGGFLGGGGGGGSGGLVVLEAPLVTRAGRVTANGGGGGEGGAFDSAEILGAPGSDGAINTSPAPGGNTPVPPSRGGEGAAGNQRDGEFGTPSDEAGGGGGGGMGYLRVTMPPAAPTLAQQR